MRLVASAYYHGHHPGTEVAWVAGEVREVPEATAAYLLDVHGALFAKVEPVEPVEVVPEIVAPVTVAVVSAPTLDRQIKSPKGRKP